MSLAIMRIINSDKHIAKFLNHYQQDSLLYTLILSMYDLTLSEAKKDLSAVSLFLSDSSLKGESANLLLAKRAYVRDKDIARSFNLKTFLV